MRINRFLAASGLGSRRSCEELILAGEVTINGQICQNLATEVAESDFVKVGSRRITPEKHFYILLHKPRGFLCTASDTHGRRTIFELLPAQWPRLFHVGRLDRDSEGLLILTNDGALALHLTHPRYKIEKEYEVLLDRPFNGPADTARLLRGVSIEGGRAKADAVKQLSPMLLRIVLRQGLKRQIRLMLYKVGYEVKRLVRTRIGGLRLADLRPGEWRALTGAEVEGLRKERPAAPAPAAADAGSARKKKSMPKEKAPPGAGPRRGSQSAPAAGRREAARHRPGRGAASARGKSSGKGPAASAPRAGRRP